jgi:hypothetical protein
MVADWTIRAERSVLESGTVTDAKLIRAIEKIRARAASDGTTISPALSREMATFVVRVHKLSSKPQAPDRNDILGLRSEVRSLTWKLAAFAWRVAKGHVVLGAAFLAGKHQGGARGALIMCIASIIYAKQWELTLKVGAGWLKHKAHLLALKSIVAALNLPITIPAWMFKKVRCKLREKKEAALLHTI